MKPIDPTPLEPNDLRPNRPAPPRPASSRFPKGTSGNPKGRPRGSRNRATLLIESLLQERAESLTLKVIELAEAGDSLALRICMDRLLPVQKDRPIDLPLGPVETLPQIRSALSTIVQSIGDGCLTPTAGETVAQVLHLQSEVVTSAELAPRVAQLEEQIAALQDQNRPGNSGPAEVVEILRADRTPRKDEPDAA